MQSAVPQGVGAMAAILGLEDEQVKAICAEAAQGEVVEAVNFNSSGQVVIAGNAAAHSGYKGEHDHAEQVELQADTDLRTGDAEGGQTNGICN